MAADLNRMRNIFLVTLPLAVLLVGGGGWLVAGRALRPLRRIRQMAEQVTARGLDQRISVAAEDPEIAGLVQVLNGMMDRLEASFNQATRFSADASHELKTPLAIMQGELENALQAAEPGSSQQQVFSNLLGETQRIKTITRGLLLLAQADAGRLKVALEDVDMSAALEGMCRASFSSSETSGCSAAKPGRLSRRRLGRRLHVWEPGLLLDLCRIVRRAGAIGAARAGSIAQAMPPALTGAVALSHSAPRAICARATVGADPAIGLETRGLAGSAFFLGLGRAAIATALGAGDRFGRIMPCRRRSGIGLP